MSELSELLEARYSREEATYLTLRDSVYHRVMIITKYIKQHGAIEIYENPLAPEHKRFMLITDRSKKVVFSSSLEALSKWIEINLNAGGITLIDSLFYWG